MLSISRVLLNLNVKKTGIISTIVLLFSIFLFVLPIEKLVRKKMRNVSATLPSSASFKLICFLKSLFFLSLLKELVLKPGTELRELWTKAPFPLTFKVYVFNITNPQEVTDGGKVCIYLLMRWKLLIFCVFFIIFVSRHNFFFLFS